MHSSEEILKQLLAQAAESVAVGEIYTHYKDSSKTYEVISLALAEDDETVQVVYKALYGAHLTFTRPLASWCQAIEVDGKTLQRFTRL